MQYLKISIVFILILGMIILANLRDKLLKDNVKEKIIKNNILVILSTSIGLYKLKLNDMTKDYLCTTTPLPFCVDIDEIIGVNIIYIPFINVRAKDISNNDKLKLKLIIEDDDTLEKINGMCNELKCDK